MPKPDNTLARLRQICLTLPDTKETVAWRHPAFRVGEKMFCGYEELDGKMTIGFKLAAPHAELLAQDPRVVRSQNFGKHKWVSIDAAGIDDWAGIADMIRESYRLSASRRTLAGLDAALGAAGLLARRRRGRYLRT